MKVELTATQVQLLQSILRLSLEIEKTNTILDQINSENQTKVEEISQLLMIFRDSQKMELLKLSEIPRHFSATMSLRHFVNLMIPIERLLDRQLSDADFDTTFLDSSPQKLVRRPCYFILDNIRSAFNVGAIFRLADSVGISEVALCGYTPTLEQVQVKKTSMQADMFVNHQIFDKAESAITHYQKLGIQVLALETANQAIGLYEQPLIGPTAFLLGNERFGLDNSLLSKVTGVRKIPMFGVKNSLNVGQAAAIAAFEWSRQNP